MFKTPFLLAFLVAVACGAVVTPEAPIPSPDADGMSMMGPMPSSEAGGLSATGLMPSPGVSVLGMEGPMPSPGVGVLGMEGPMPSPGVGVLGMEGPMPSPGDLMPWESPSAEESSAAAPGGGMEAGELEECKDPPCGETVKPGKMMGGRKLRGRRMRKRKSGGPGMGDGKREGAMPEASGES